jgi:hypothetical protein
LQKTTSLDIGDDKIETGILGRALLDGTDPVSCSGRVVRHFRDLL